MPLCSVCIGDDGAGAEGDTVNDDVEIVLGGKASDTHLGALRAVLGPGVDPDDHVHASRATMATTP